MTHSTLTEQCLTPTNYRGRLHELLYVEELARHEQIARYNEVMQLRLSSNYNISLDSNRSVTTKYAPPGELFAEVSYYAEPHDRLVLYNSRFILLLNINEIKKFMQKSDISLAASGPRRNRGHEER
jgi:hypothetical protein